jgi:hypothetical protein
MKIPHLTGLPGRSARSKPSHAAMNLGSSIRAILCLAACAGGLSGCATSRPAPATVTSVSITRTAGVGASIAAVAIEQTDGEIYASGTVELTDWRPGNGVIRVEVSLRDAAGRELARQTNAVPIQSRTARAGLRYRFRVRLEPWPAGTAGVSLRARLI